MSIIEKIINLLLTNGYNARIHFDDVVPMDVIKIAPALNFGLEDRAKKNKIALKKAKT
jgi:hypothetical protein